VHSEETLSFKVLHVPLLCKAKSNMVLVQGASYRGIANTTKDGQVCAQYSTAQLLQGVQNGLAGNYCRNPLGENQWTCYRCDSSEDLVGVGCYDLNGEYQRCNVPFCEDADDPMANAVDSGTTSSADSSGDRSTDGSTGESGFPSDSSSSNSSNSDGGDFDIADVFEGSNTVRRASFGVWARTVHAMLALWLLCPWSPDVM
jgi:hypothetical protein